MLKGALKDRIGFEEETGEFDIPAAGIEPRIDGDATAHRPLIGPVHDHDQEHIIAAMSVSAEVVEEFTCNMVVWGGTLHLGPVEEEVVLGLIL